MRQQALRQKLAEREATGKGHDDPGDRDRDGGTADLADQRQVGFHAGKQQQQQDAELRQPVDQGLLFAGRRKNRVLRLRPKPAEQGRAEQQSSQQFPHHRRLAEPLHQLAKPAAYRDQQRNLDQEDEFGRPRGVVAPGIRRRHHEKENRGGPE
jgi:hypothetical protein